MSTEITLQDSPLASNLGFLKVNSIGEAMQVGEMIKQSGFAPPKMSVVDIVLAIQMGLEIGLKPLQAVQNISVINGKPSLWGDAMIALCKQHHDWEWSQETFDAETQTAKCVVKRRGEPEVVSEFSMEMAKKARLSGKQGPWQDYPQRMLQMRARGFALRDAFPDALKGLISTEEAQDYPPRKDLSKEKAYTIDVETTPVETIQPETLAELGGFILSQEVDESRVNKWLEYAKVDNLTLLPETFAQTLVKKFREHEDNIRKVEADATQWDGRDDTGHGDPA